MRASSAVLRSCRRGRLPVAAIELAKLAQRMPALLVADAAKAERMRSPADECRGGCHHAIPPDRDRIACGRGRGRCAAQRRVCRRAL